MTDCSSKETYAAAAPCSVLSVLLEAGVIKDPYYRENEKSILPYLEKDFILSRDFNVDGELMQEDCIELVFYGLDHGDILKRRKTGDHQEYAPYLPL